MRTLILLTAILVALPTVAAQAPPTVYEPEGNDVPPQMMDFDAENNRFVAHPGWIDGKLIHYYKFRMYVPPNYGTDDGGLEKVPIQELYLPTTDGTLAGVPADQRPVLSEYPVAGNTDYSDFQHVVLVDVGGGYAANSHTDAAGVLAAGSRVDTGIIANVPVVPLGSTLEDPAELGTDAPIEPWMAWYEGDEAQTFVFETTSAEFADFINPRTRSGAFAEAGSGYEAAVSPQMATLAGVNALPIWHVNQYTTGVEAGVNNGGPSGVGQRNVIDADRLDPGYSPLWQVWWATQVPPGYSADEAVSAEQITDESGFAIAKTPMYVNCPNIGPHGGSPADRSVDAGLAFDPVARVDEGGSVVLEGSIPMQAGVEVTAMAGDAVLGTATTAMMGLYTFTVEAGDLPEGLNTVTFEDPGGAVVGTYEVQVGSADHGAGAASEDASALGTEGLIVLLVVAGAILVFARFGK